MLQIFAIAIVQFLVALLSPFIASGIGLAYFFTVIQSAARRREQLPDTQDFLGVSQLVLPWIRFTAATLLIWVPALLYIHYGPGWMGVLETPKEVLVSGPMIALVIIGIVYTPAALTTAGVADSALAALNPVITFRMIGRIPGQYALTVGVWISLILADWLFGFAIAAASAISVPIVTPIIGWPCGWPACWRRPRAHDRPLRCVCA